MKYVCKSKKKVSIELKILSSFCVFKDVQFFKRIELQSFCYSYLMFSNLRVGSCI